MAMWKIMAGRGSASVNAFVEQSLVAIGWSEAGDHTTARARAELIERFERAYPDNTPRQHQVGASQVWRFLTELRQSDRVVVYDPELRLYHVGEILDVPVYEPARIEGLPVTRSVRWLGQVNRDSLSSPTRNTLGAILTLFKLSDSAEIEIASKLDGKPLGLSQHREIGVESLADDELVDLEDPFANIADQALELIKDRILRLEWDEMQELVAALLRALGYRTIVSPSGSDRGRDIIASRDGFGFEPPRIVVEVKHRKGAMGAPEVRAFLGGRHVEDRGLYVSTGGFTREAQYEAERAATVTHLMTLDGLARALVEQYENLDDRGRTLLPLIRIYWPA
jgi:restriction system protein